MSLTLGDQDKLTLRTAAYGAVSLLAAGGSPHRIATDGSVALASATGPILAVEAATQQGEPSLTLADMTHKITAALDATRRDADPCCNSFARAADQAVSCQRPRQDGNGPVSGRSAMVAAMSGSARDTAGTISQVRTLYVRRFMMGHGNSGFSEAGLRRLREVLARHVESGKIPGLVALVGRGEETHVEAIGTMQHDGGAPMRRDTIFRMASTSKPVTMAAAMVLLDECRLRLDDPVDEWLPELADRQVLARADGPLEDTVPARRPITVRDLLTSTFGLGVDLTLMGSPIMAAVLEQANYNPETGPAPDPDEWMRSLGELPLAYQPGERWQYELSHDVLAVLVARVTGQTFETFLRDRVFDPLGMKDTGFHVPADKIDRLPPSYAPDPQTGEFHVWDEAASGRYSRPPAFQHGGGGLVSTADDYHAYFRMLLNGGMHGSERILSRPAVELMTTNRLTPEQNAARNALATDNVHVSFGQGQQGGWGFGMAVRTYRGDYASVGQFGWDGGTGTTVYADPDKQLTGILLTQVGLSTPDPARLIHDFWTTLYQAIDD